MFKTFFNSRPTYRFTVCHRLPERSFYFRDKQFPLCSRCTGIALGYFLYPFFIFDLIALPVGYALFFNTPMIIDGITQTIFERQSNNLMRFITGFLAGVSQVAIVDIFAKFISYNIFEIVR